MIPATNESGKAYDGKGDRTRSQTLVNASKSSLAIKHTATEFKPATND